MWNRFAENSRRERGVVLLLALVALLLISAVGAAILFMTASESSLVGFQRRTTRTLDAAVGATDEARGRLSTTDPSFLGNWQSGQVEFPNAEVVGGAGMGVGANLQVLYILNPAAGEVVAPMFRPPPGVSNPYYDRWFATEWGVNIETLPPCPAPPVVPPGVPPPAPLTVSCWWFVMSDMWSVGGPFAGLAPPIPYKWARITLLTERAANRDIDNSGLPLDNNIPIFWNSGANGCFPSPGLCLYPAIRNTMNVFMNPGMDTDLSGQVESYERVGRAVYRITALAALEQQLGRAAPTGTVRVVQYDVGGVGLTPRLPAAVSIIGTGSTCGATTTCTFNAGTGTYSNCDGNVGGWGPSNAAGGTGTDQAPGSTEPPRPAFAADDPNTATDCYNELARLPTGSGHLDNWTGGPGGFGGGPLAGNTTGQINVNQYADTTTTAGLLQLMNEIRQVADQTISAADPPPNSDLDPTNDLASLAGVDLGTCSVDRTVMNPKITVVDGDVNLGNVNGCGILLVTGDAIINGNMPTWKGLVLVVGEGSFNVAAGGGNGQIDGALLVARIYCDEDNRPGQPNADPNCGGPWPAPPLNPPGGSQFAFTGGGRMAVNYDSFWIGSAFNSVRYQVLAYREFRQ